MEHYFTIEQPSFAEFKDRGSKFLAFAYPIKSASDFKKHLQDLKKEHPKAVHLCFAYRIGFTGDEFRSSDDGEPSGSAGKPILGQIDSKSLTNVMVVVVRYFGGTLLGVPGLINAYKSAASMSLQLTPLVKKQIEIIFDLEFDYTISNEVMRVIKKYGCTLFKQDMQLFCNFEIGIPKQHEIDCLKSFEDIRGVVLKKKSDSGT
jgi:uncharacterized YigZ family protein